MVLTVEEKFSPQDSQFTTAELSNQELKEEAVTVRLNAKGLERFAQLKRCYQELKALGLAKRALLCLNGEAPEKAFPQDASTLYFFVDGALTTILNFLKRGDLEAKKLQEALKENYVICTGDFDSCASLAQQASLMTQYCKELFVFELKDQSQTDFYKTLELVQALGIEEVHVYGFGGKSTDHLLGNFTTAYQFKNKFKQFVFYDNSSEIFFLEGKGVVNRIYTQINYTISLFPYYQATAITTSGLHWNLNQDTLDQRVNSSIRNYADAELIEITFEQGDLLCFKGLAPYDNLA